MINVKNPSLPPWTLKGQGHILVYKFPKSFIEKNGYLADYQTNNFKGFFGTIMIVDYAKTPVGPYKELLFVPGIFDLNGSKNFSISKIYVDNQDSVDNGTANWGIPKEFADFEIMEENGLEKISVSKNGLVFFEANIKKNRFWFPISTAFFPLKLKQKLFNKFLITNSTAKGKACFSSAKINLVNQTFFPDISSFKPILSFSVKDFSMVFPIPTIENNKEL